jgi:hypothetical protein
MVGGCVPPPSLHSPTYTICPSGMFIFIVGSIFPPKNLLLLFRVIKNEFYETGLREMVKEKKEERIRESDISEPLFLPSKSNSFLFFSHPNWPKFDVNSFDCQK